jgi:aminopeptidase
MDERWILLAKQLIQGVDVKAGTKVSIFMSDFGCMDAVSAFVAECYKAGAMPQVLASDEKFDRIAQQFASEEILKRPADLEVLSMEWADAHVSFRGMVAPNDDIDQRKVAIQRRGKGIVSTKRWQETRWCLVRVPSTQWAEMLDVDYENLLDEFFGGCIADWEQTDSLQSELCDVLNQASQLAHYFERFKFSFVNIRAQMAFLPQVTQIFLMEKWQVLHWKRKLMAISNFREFSGSQE